MDCPRCLHELFRQLIVTFDGSCIVFKCPLCSYQTDIISEMNRVKLPKPWRVDNLLKAPILGRKFG